MPNLQKTDGNDITHYKVRVFGDLTDDMLKQISRGISVDGIEYAPMELVVLRETSGKNHWLKCILTEGKNREIRKIFEHFGLRVNRLIRTQYGDYSLNDMKPGEVVPLTGLPW